MSKTAIVILNYNGRNFLEKFLPSVISHSAGFLIYVADNASTDDSVQWLKIHYPQIHLLQLSTNKGYAGGYNEALKEITADYYVLLNSDVEVSPQWLPPMVQFLDENPTIAACQPKILAHHNPDQFEYAGACGGFVDWLGYPYCRGRIFDFCETDTGQYDSIIPIFWASGACLVIRASAFHEVGGFDEVFFAHMEEIDLCWRLHHVGYQVYCYPLSKVWHVGGGTLPASSPFKTYLNYRNSLAMLYKNLDKHLWSTIFLRLVLDGISSVRFLIKGQWKDILAIIKAHFKFYEWVLGTLPQKRKKIQQNLPFQKEQRPLPIVRKSIIWAYFVKGIKTFDSFSRF